ncbi:hypothetical protein LTR85_007942 [Meristemomyces frigidus]|nr:hypothetical protein LTR85_007942 [Meristemomyces frigidus]
MPTTEITLLHPTITGGDKAAHGQAISRTNGHMEAYSELDTPQSCYFGRQVEYPDLVEAMITWKDALAHDEKHRAHASVEDGLHSLPPGNLFINRVSFSPFDDFTKAITAPVTEVATLYYNGTPPPDSMDGLVEMRRVFSKHQIPGWRALAGGITHEAVEYEGAKGKAVVLVIGWESVEQHMAWRATQLYAETLHLWPRGAEKLEMHHTAFRSDLNALTDGTQAACSSRPV